MSFKKVTPFINHTVRGLCCLPYSGKKGCPNFGKKECCPPNAPLVENYFNLSEPVYAVYVVFNMESHVKRMKAKHPQWSEKQARCCLYWQGTVRKQLRQEIGDSLVFLSMVGLSPWKTRITLTPEALGVDMSKTMISVGVELQWPPRDKVYKIALIGEAGTEGEDYLK